MGDSASHGAQQVRNLGLKNAIGRSVCGKNAKVVLIAQVVRGVCVAATATMSLFLMRNCWFEGDALCYAFFLIKELLSKGFARANAEAHNSCFGQFEEHRSV